MYTHGIMQNKNILIISNIYILKYTMQLTRKVVAD